MMVGRITLPFGAFGLVGSGFKASIFISRLGNPLMWLDRASHLPILQTDFQSRGDVSSSFDDGHVIIRIGAHSCFRRGAFLPWWFFFCVNTISLGIPLLQAITLANRFKSSSVDLNSENRTHQTLFGLAMDCDNGREQ
jgi:hypothetical protein